MVLHPAVAAFRLALIAAFGNSRQFPQARPTVPDGLSAAIKISLVTEFALVLA
jgi:hypothetical protein